MERAFKTLEGATGVADDLEQDPGLDARVAHILDSHRRFGEARHLFFVSEAKMLNRTQR
jgi:hypothetical protein